jgi:hypothetical protein
MYSELRTQFNQMTQYQYYYRKWVTFEGYYRNTPEELLQNYDYILTQLETHYQLELNYNKKIDITHCPIDDYNRLSKKLLDVIEHLNKEFYNDVMKELLTENDKIYDNDYAHTKDDFELVKSVIYYIGTIRCHNNTFTNW